MKRLLQRLKGTDYRHYTCVAITIGFAACFLMFVPSLQRLVESGRDLGLSTAFYFCEIFEIPHEITPTVTEMPDTQANVFLPFTWEEFREKWALYWQTWATWENVGNYFERLADLLVTLMKVLVIVLPFVLLFVLLFQRYVKTDNNDYDKDSKPLTTWKRLTAKIYRPAKQWLKGFFAFVKEKDAYWKIWLVMWLFYFNAFAIVLEFIAYYLYFVAAFDFSTLYRQFVKLFMDLATVATFVPLWAWLAIGFVLFDKIRKKIAYGLLHRFEMRNRGFINERPIVFMINGTMGKKKTTMLTDVGLSQEAMFRDKAFEKILESDLKFPFFPWINLERELQRAMEFHHVFNLATTRQFVRTKKERWLKEPCKEKIFHYDYERYGLTYDDKLKVVDVWEVLETYAQLYFIYVIESSLLISNYAVRADNVMQTIGNFPTWDTEFFKRDSRLLEAYSRHSHIIDFDCLRLGKKVADDNGNADGFEFGVVLLTEIGKERGNKTENEDKKKKDFETNVKNDGFDNALKMIRHSATVDNFPFVRIVTDEQRAMSWGANARELCDLVHIRESGEFRLTMPFFTIGEMLHDWLYGRFTDLYYKYRFVRSDNTLFMYLLKGAVTKFHHYYVGIHNRFDYCPLLVQTERGTQDGAMDDGKYYLMTKKIYSKRFATDCYSEYFAEKVLRSDVGVEDMPEYATERATFDELKQQHSYFVNDLLDGMRNKK